LRARFQIKDTVKAGALITKVDPRSDAAEKHLQAGEVVLEINQEQVADPADAIKKIKGLKEAGKKTALLVVANGHGDTHFVALPLE
jgi:serine protease Do